MAGPGGVIPNGVLSVVAVQDGVSASIVAVAVVIGWRQPDLNGAFG